MNFELTTYDMEDLELETHQNLEAPREGLTRLIFDLESGGLNRDSDVIQFGWIKTDWDFRVLEFGQSFYKNNKPMEEGAVKVHGFTAEFLWSVADTFFQTALPTLEQFAPDNNTMFISFSDYDIQKVREVCYRIGEDDPFGEKVPTLHNLPPIDGNNYFDALALTGRRLVQSVTEQEREEAKELAKTMGANAEAHDALFDSILLLLLLKRWYND